MKKILITTFLLTLGLSSCNEDFLTVIPETNLSSATFFKKEADFQQAINAAYVPLRAITNDRSWLLGEMHSDNAYYYRNILFGATEQQEDIADFSIPTANGLSSTAFLENGFLLIVNAATTANTTQINSILKYLRLNIIFMFII